jgi:hypothetical protein
MSVNRQGVTVAAGGDEGAHQCVARVLQMGCVTFGPRELASADEV